MAQLSFRPEGYRGSVEDHFPQIQNALVKALAMAQRDLSNETLILDRPMLKALAAILVEFAEDLHCEIGIWSSLEDYHRAFFGTPLPFVGDAGAAPPPQEIAPARVQHLLWVLYPQLIPDLLLSPDDADLSRLAEVAAGVLQEQFADLPRESGVKQFLGTPDEYGWDVKRKLIWLGTRSYLLRVPFRRYVEEQDAQPSDIATTDDFLCQHCTKWAGLGATDMLASVLDLPPARRTDLLAWSERHNAVYKVLSGNRERIEVLNVINDRRYRVLMNLERDLFPRGSFVHGSLVPWDGQWYWSGKQQNLGRLDAATVDRLKQNYRLHPTLFYRYSPAELTRARELVRQQYEEFVASHGKDWFVYPDGLAMAADWQEEARRKLESLPADEKRAIRERQGSEDLSPRMDIPRELLESMDGIGVYFNPAEGLEIFEGFHAVVAGLEKKGGGLTSGEDDAIREWVWSQSISPGFIRRLAEEYGGESIRSAFLLGDHDEDYALEYLLRRYKGRFYRPSYPTLTVVE